MKKRIFALLLLVCLAFAAVSCLDEDKNKDPEQQTNAVVTDEQGSTVTDEQGNPETYPPADTDTDAGETGTGISNAGANEETGWSELIPINPK